MSKHKVVLTAQDRKELTPLLHITKAERELMPQEILDKLEILAKEKEQEEKTQEDRKSVTIGTYYLLLHK